MPYLSRIWLNPLRTGGQRLLRNPQAAHAAVLGGVGRQPVHERVLWRLEREDPHRGDLLVLTQSLPAWEHLVEQAGWPAAGMEEPLVRPYDRLLDRVLEGREFAFRLRVNPVSSTRTPTKPSTSQQRRLAEARPRGARVAHRTINHQLEWLTQRIPKWGFALLAEGTGPAVRVVGRERLSFARLGSGGARHQVVIQTATFEGRLRIEDRQRALASLLGGVGSGRAYGCGLITLAPISSSTVS